VGARDNLLRENVAAEAILVTGNTVIDALQHARTLPLEQSALPGIPANKRIAVVTAHRRESFGHPLESICTAVEILAARFSDVQFVFPVHPNPAVRAVVAERLGGNPRVTLVEPLGYREMVALLERSRLVLTDSGGLQEEAPSLGKPVLVLRDVTERQEGVAAGTVRLVGTDTERIVEETTALLSSPGEYALMSQAVNPYGDGRASGRIADALMGRPVAPWQHVPIDAQRAEPSRRVTPRPRSVRGFAATSLPGLKR
jgi:UDP-N-acetylglucosamine 2-epimerase